LDNKIILISSCGGNKDTIKCPYFVPSKLMGGMCSHPDGPYDWCMDGSKIHEECPLPDASKIN